MSDRAALELQRQLQALNDKFAQRLQQELPELQQLAADLARPQAAQARRQQLLELRERLHKLAGAAGTFGLAELGEQARSLEQRTDRWLETDQPEKLSAFTEAIRQFASQGLASASTGTVVEPPEDDHPGSRVYLLESDFEAGSGMRHTLGNFGYQVSLYADLPSLADGLAQSLPDALIASLHQPDEIAEIGALQQRLETLLPLLVINDKADFDSHLAAVRAGAQGYFVRPIDITRLENHLERCLNLQQGEAYRVMIIDDDADLSARYSLVLRNAQMEVQVLNDPSQLFETMHAFDPEVLLLDVNMPSCTGPELAQMIRLSDDWLRVPIIYLSAETDIARQMAALLKAGDDFITKPISDSALTASVYSHAQRARSLSAALARDSLTGLLKHADIKEQLALETQRALRSSKPTSVVILDIDLFKQVNDSYGHAAGDNVIRSLANLLRQRLRRIDSLGRYGGEEFVAVLPECSAEQAKVIFDEIRLRFAELGFSAANQAFNVTFSAGISETDEHTSPDVLLERADRTLYAAKHSGRNQVCVAR